VKRVSAETTTELVAAAAVRAVGKRFGGVAALTDVSLEVNRGEALGIIGPNGAGKSTLLKILAGEHRVTTGSVEILGRDATRLPRHTLARHGVGFAHQIPQPFRGLTVRENVRVGALHHERGTGSREALAEEVLERCGLADRADRQAGSLPLLDLKRLEVARALSLRPQLLLLDEIAAGLVGDELDAVIDLLRSLRSPDQALVVVEHVERVVAEIVERVVVLDWGKVVAEGTPAEIAANALVQQIYLGSGEQQEAAARAARTAAEPAPALLRLEDVSANYGAATVLRSVDVEVGRGQIVAVLGANGAGKSTLARSISGLNRARTGRVVFDGEDVTGLLAHERARRGIAHCQEGRRLFAGLTVRENLLLGAQTAEAREAEADTLRWLDELFPILAERREQLAGTLSGGQQQMLAIGRALVARPKLLLCDEISLGLSPKATDDVYEALERVSRSGIAILLIEQNVHRSLALADYAYVLERGQVSFSGDPQELLDEERLREAYFGRSSSGGPSDGGRGSGSNGGGGSR
jgi:branched-chain amino acid transport system ATP-binding protein